jgi:hypothetical protein
MNRVLNTLADIHAECVRTDELAKAMGLSVQSTDSDDTAWGYGDSFIPRKKPKPVDALPLWLSRDVLLMPNINLEHDYTLGLKEDHETVGAKVYLCYRLNYYHEFGGSETPVEEEFPVTVFWEMPINRWRVSASLLHGTNKRNERARPAHWTEILEIDRLSGFGELAEPMSKDNAFMHIHSMMRIAVAHGVSRNKLQQLRSGHGRRSR